MTAGLEKNLSAIYMVLNQCDYFLLSVIMTLAVSWPFKETETTEIIPQYIELIDSTSSINN